MVTLIIDSGCDFVKTSEQTPRGGLKFVTYFLKKKTLIKTSPENHQSMQMIFLQATGELELWSSV